MAKPEAQDDRTYDDDGQPLSGELIAPIRQDVSSFVAAEINQQVATAKRFPRRSDAIITAEIMGRAGLDEETAADCMYTLPRAGKDITGPSIRFAELVFISFGNLRAGARFVELDTKDQRRAAVVIDGFCMDLQTNVAVVIPVRRSIVGKKGIFGADMTNIAFSAGAAIARREAILKMVPKSVWGPAYKRVISILQGDATTLVKRRADVLAAFGRRDIKPDRVFAALGVDTIEAITVEHMPRLFGMLTALADGSESVESMFALTGSTAGGERHNPLADDAGETTHPETGEVQAGQGTAAQDKPAAKPAESTPKEVVSEPQAAAQPAQDAAKPAEAPKAAAKPAQATTASAPANGDRPADEASYVQHVKAWLATATSESTIKDRWATERKLRTDCKVSGAVMDNLTGLRDDRIAQLKKG